MRVADKMSQVQVNTGLNRNRNDLNKLQNQAATQKRVVTPSDDPVAATRVLKQRSEIQGIDQYLKNITSAKNFLEYSEQSLGELSDLLIRAKELALGQAGDAASSAETRAVVATEIQQLFHQAVHVGNRKLGDRFLFGGFKTTEAPFTPEGQYVGDHGEMRIPINKEAKVAINVPGSSIFLGYKLNRPVEIEPLENEERELTIPLESGNSGQLAIARAPASDLRIRSVDDDKFAKDQQSIHDSNIANHQGPAAGTAQASSQKGVNVFKVMDDLRISLETNDKQGVQESLNMIDEAMSQVVLARSQLGSRVTVLDQTFNTLQRSNVDAKIVKSQAEDVDTFELVTDINKAENTLKTSLHTSSKLLESSLLDFLR